MLSDLKTAIRGLRAAPGFTAVALIVLMLGIGASTAIFSVVDAVILRGLPFDEYDRLVSVTEKDTKTGRPSGSNAPQNYNDWRAGQQVFSGLFAMGGGGGYILRGGAEPRDIRTRRVTHEFFDVLRVQPAIGRGFTKAHETEGSKYVAVLSHGLWQSQFAGDPAIVGKTIKLDNGTFEVLGVMPAGFAYPVGVTQFSEMWVPFVTPADEVVRGNSRSYYLSITGRLKDGVSMDQARAQMEQVTAGMAKQFPDWFTDRSVLLRPLHEALVGNVRQWMLMLLGAVAFVLLIACVNVANLMLARAMSRSREMTVRGALGASRWQLARSLFVESLVLSVAGAVLGVFVAWAGVELMRAWMPANVPRIADIGIDLRVLAVTAATAIATGVFFGLLPALQFSRPNLSSALREGGRSSTAGVRRQWLRSALVVSEVALAVVLLVGCGLFIASFSRLMSVDVGVNYDSVLTVSVPSGELRSISLMTEAERTALSTRYAAKLEDVLGRVKALPGVTVASLHSGGMPLSGSSSRTSVRIPGGKDFSGPGNGVEIRRVSADYYRAMGIPLVAGRVFNDGDRAEAPPVVILNALAAKKYFEGADPLGKSIDVNGVKTIVGIVGDIRAGGPETDARPEAAVPIAQAKPFNAELVIRTSGEPHKILPDLRNVIHAVSPDAVIPQATSMEEYFGRLIAQRRFNMLMLSLFGGLGLVIAAVGIYGVMAYIVAQRTSEFGVRMALGAPRAGILMLVLRRAAIYMAVGLVAGLGAAVLLSKTVTTFLFRVEPRDPVVYSVVAATLLLVGLVAALIPAFRASRVDPVVALRTE
jgi:putative ABC transport system permease protein